jgi:hypothetical protein
MLDYSAIRSGLGLLFPAGPVDAEEPEGESGDENDKGEGIGGVHFFHPLL